MYFEQIHPFVRYIRYLEFSNKTYHPVQIPYDARLFYMYKGNGKIETKNKTYQLARGSLIIINSDVRYRFHTDRHAVYIAINFDYTYNHFSRRFPISPAVAGTDYNENLVLEHISFTDTDMLNEALFVNNMLKLENTLIEMSDISKKKPLYYSSRLSMLMTNVLLECVNSFCSDNNNRTYSNAAKQIIEYIHENYNHDISNKQIGAFFNFHPNYVNSIIKKYAGMPLHAYVLFVKVSNAVNLLDSTGSSIEQISAAVGFSSPARFSAQFKKIIGTSPASYRKNSK